MKIYWDDTLAECGIYHLCINDKSLASIYDIRVKAETNIKLHDWERKKLLDEGNYEFSTCFDGFSHSHYTNAATLEEAKAEAIAWFINYYTKGIEQAKERIKYCEKMVKIFEEV